MIRQSLIRLFLKIGLAVPFVYFALISFTKSLDTANYYPNFLVRPLSEAGVVIFGGIVSLAIALWLVSNRKSFYASLTAMVIVGLGLLINITNLGLVVLLIPLFCIALSLFFKYYPRVRVLQPAVEQMENLAPDERTTTSHNLTEAEMERE